MLPLKTVISHWIIVLTAINSIVLAKIVDFQVFPDDPEGYIRNLGWLFDVEDNTVDKNEEYTVCKTSACRTLAKHMMRGLNKSADPCEDFYAYTCGGWDSQDLIPPYEPSWGSAKIFQEAVTSRIKDILETDPEPTDILPVRQAKKWYTSCMDVKEREKRGIKPVESILMRSGGWPMIMEPEEWDADENSWSKVEKHLFHYFGSFIFYKIEPSWRIYSKRHRNEITIAKGILPLSMRNGGQRKFTNKYYTAYVELITSIAQLFIDHSRADVADEALKKDVKDLVEFEEKLQKMSNEYYKRLDTSVGEFIKAYNKNISRIGYKDWIDFRDRVQMVFDTDNIEIEDSNPMIVLYPDYFLNLTKLLSETPTRTIVNYLYWNFISNVLQYTSEKVKDIFFKLAQIEDGVDEKMPRWMTCVEEVKMQHATSYAFVKKYFQESTEKAALEMIKNIKIEMESQIDKSTWLDDKSKELAKGKLNKMRVFLGSPDWYQNRTAIMNSYRGLKIGYDYFENNLSYKRYKTKATVRAMNQAKEKGPVIWNMVPPVMVNAVYGLHINALTVPAADFQPPLFTPQVPQSINYGMTGVVVGHEIGHGFDASGILYGVDGSKTKLSKQMIEAFSEQTECFLHQFNGYYGVTEPVYESTTSFRNRGLGPGLQTMSENIADTTGLYSVFKAYKKMISKQPNGDSKLPGFEEYTDDQMFFLAFGTAWCEVRRPEYAEAMLAFDTHSSNHLRVIGATSNTKDFAEAFNCPKGSAMNPENKCNIWKGAVGNNKKPDPTLSGHGKYSRWEIKWD